MSAWQRSFTVEGLNVERFLRQAGEQGIALTALRRRGTRRLSARARERDLPALQALALRGGWQLMPGDRVGIGARVQRITRRWLLLAGLCCGLIAILLMTQIMWRIEITGAGTYTPDIASALAEMGVTVPMRKAAVNIGTLRDALEWRYPRIAWFECGWRGMTLVIRAEEGVLPLTEVSPDGPRDVVADRDGIVHSIVTQAGTPVVAIGDLVREGEVLIRGEERMADGLVKPVAARGTVTARTWVGTSVLVPLTETETAFTGREQTVWTVSCPWFDLWRMPESGFAEQDVSIREVPLGGFLLPLTLRTETRMEAEISQTTRDPAAVAQEAEAAALRRLHEKIGTGESVVDIWGNCSIIEDEILYAAFGEILRDIAVQQPASGMTAPERGEDQPLT